MRTCQTTNPRELIRPLDTHLKKHLGYISKAQTSEYVTWIEDLQDLHLIHRDHAPDTLSPVHTSPPRASKRLCDRGGGEHERGTIKFEKVADGY